jgi:hypothetical protein
MTGPEGDRPAGHRSTCRSRPRAPLNSPAAASAALRARRPPSVASRVREAHSASSADMASKPSGPSTFCRQAAGTGGAPVEQGLLPSGTSQSSASGR